MTDAEMQWLAGYLEGEGSFIFSAGKVQATGYVKHNFGISVDCGRSWANGAKNKSTS